MASTLTTRRRYACCWCLFVCNGWWLVLVVLFVADVAVVAVVGVGAGGVCVRVVVGWWVLFVVVVGVGVGIGVGVGVVAVVVAAGVGVVLVGTKLNHRQRDAAALRNLAQRGAPGNGAAHFACISTAFLL